MYYGCELKYNLTIASITHLLTHKTVCIYDHREYFFYKLLGSIISVLIMPMRFRRDDSYVCVNRMIS